jgi:hypothetical protein
MVRRSRCLVRRSSGPWNSSKRWGSMASGQLPPPLSPFLSSSGIFVPVIVRVEIVDRVLRQVFVIFVPADAERLGALFEGSSLPMRMPTTLKSLVHLLRLMFRARWDVIEPRRGDAIRNNPSRERCAELVRLIMADYEELSSDLANLHIGGDDAFHEIFDQELWGEIDACSREWLDLVSGLRTKSPDNAQELVDVLTELRSNIGKWLKSVRANLTEP